MTSPDNLTRFVVESKCSADHVDAVAMDKCGRLRGGQLTRVLILYGHGDGLRWIDLGPMGAEASPPTSEFPLKLPALPASRDKK